MWDKPAAAGKTSPTGLNSCRPASGGRQWPGRDGGAERDSDGRTQHRTPAHPSRDADRAGPPARARRREPGPVGAGQYRALVRQIQESLRTPLPAAALQAILKAHPATAEIYENLHYDTSGLSRTSLDVSVATEMLATQLIHRIARTAAGR